MTTPNLLWQPDRPSASRGRTSPTSRARLPRNGRRRAARLRDAVALVDRSVRGVLARGVGLSPASSASAASARSSTADKMPGAKLVSRCAPQFRREPACTRPRDPTTRRRARLSRRGQAVAPRCPTRSSSARARASRGADGARVSSPAIASPPTFPNMPETIIAMLAATSLGAVWSSCSPDFGVQRRARPLRPDRAEGALHRRRLLVRRQGAVDPRQGRRDRRRAAFRRARRRRSVSARLGRARGRHAADPRRGRAGTTSSRRIPRGADRVRAPAVRPSALHPVFVGHDRRAEMHRPRRRRHAAPASQGASCCTAT